MSRKLLWLPFWLGVLLTALGYAVGLPVARLGCFLLAAALSVGGIFVPQRGYRIAAALLLIVALASAYILYRHGQNYLTNSPPSAAKVIAKAQAPNQRAGGESRMALLFHAERAWPAAPQHDRWAP